MRLRPLKDFNLKIYRKNMSGQPQLGYFGHSNKPLSKLMFERLYSEIQDFQVLYVNACMFATVVNFQDMCQSLVIVVIWFWALGMAFGGNGHFLISGPFGIRVLEPCDYTVFWPCSPVIALIFPVASGRPLMFFTQRWYFAEMSDGAIWSA